MPTLLTHAAVPIALAIGLGARTVPPRLLATGVLACVLPDLDGLGLHFGIAYDAAWGHRGASHSLVFALLLAALAAAAAPALRSRRWPAAAFIFVSAASHGLLDMLTNGGRGVALWWPFSDERLFWPWRPIEASPMSLKRLATERGLDVLASELVWVWVAAAVVAAVLWGWRRAARRLTCPSCPSGR